MRQFYRYVLLLLFLNIFIVAGGVLLNILFGLNLPLKDIIILSSFFSFISAVTVIIFLRGYSRDTETQAMHTLVAISLKLLLDMVLALGWFFISKKNTLTSVFIFFVIYLTLTLFTIFVILKILKYRYL